MNFLKKQSVGFYLTAITIILSLVGVILYATNCNAPYYKAYGMNTTIVVLTVIAIVTGLIYLLGSEFLGDNKKYLDIFAVVTAVLLMVAFVLFLNERVASVATIMTFENNASNMADLTAALVGIAFYLIAVVLSIVTSFHKVVKEDVVQD